MNRSLRVPPAHANRRSETSAWPERRLREPHLAVDRVGDAEGAESRLERRAQPLDARADDADSLGCDPAAEEREKLLADELERAARARRFEEAHGPVDRDRVVRLVCEERPLEVRDRGPGDLGVARRQLLDAPRGETLKVFCRSPQRREGGTPGLVRQRDAHLGASGERLEERPFGSREVLEAVREDGLRRARRRGRTAAARPRAAEEVAVPEAEAVELRAVGRIEAREVAGQLVRVEEARLELSERPQRARRRSRRSAPTRRGRRAARR